MQLTVDLPFDQLMNLIKHLPANQIAKLNLSWMMHLLIARPGMRKRNSKSFC